jgi:3-hydroxyacyl-[acyl-carrier-protein] dehydratase
MNLKEDFFTIVQETVGEQEFEYLISLNKEHFIYQAHFPGNPITPGVCIIQLCKELLEHRIGAKLFLQKITNVKFLAVMNPTEHAAVQVAFSKVSPSAQGCTCSVLVYCDAVRFAKLSLCLENENK